MTPGPATAIALSTATTPKQDPPPVGRSPPPRQKRDGGDRVYLGIDLDPERVIGALLPARFETQSTWRE